MKTIKASIMNVIEFRNVVPMFLPQVEQSMTDEKDIYNDDMRDDVSLFDVKNLYDIAYAIKDTGDEDSAIQFKEALSAAVKLDMVYRRQLANNKQIKPDYYQNYAVQIEQKNKTSLDKNKAA